MECYHIFPNARVACRTKNHYETYSPRCVFVYNKEKTNTLLKSAWIYHARKLHSRVSVTHNLNFNPGMFHAFWCKASDPSNMSHKFKYYCISHTQIV